MAISGSETGKMKRSLRILMIALAMMATYSYGNTPSLSIDVGEFGAVPDDGKNDAGALRAAVKACRDKGATVLTIPPGQYLLADDKAIELQNDVFAGKYNDDVQGPLFNKTYKYAIGLDFRGMKNLTLNKIVQIK